MTKTQVEVITSVERRRRWSRAEKERIVAASLEPGAIASAVARQFGVHASQVFRWRQQLCGGTEPAGFAAVAITSEPRKPATRPGGVIEIELPTGARIRISRAVDAATVSAVIAALMAASR
ncbi:MAG TPA: transposase [Candidatus Cybelea sp.]|nr:transposase [Candidatus Cybelea sp.]